MLYLININLPDIDKKLFETCHDIMFIDDWNIMYYILNYLMQHTNFNFRLN